MFSGHTWKWLAPRVDAKKIAKGTGKAIARPCLPAIEALDDRLLLSTTDGGGGKEPPPIITNAFLGFLKGELGSGENSLMNLELDLMRTASDMFWKIGDNKFGDAHLITDSLVKISDVMFNYVGDILTGKATPLQKVQLELDDSFSKLTAFAESFGQSKLNTLLPAVQSVKFAANELLSKLTVPPNPILPADSKLYFKLNSYFSEISSGLIKLGEDVIFNKVDTGDQKYLEIKLDSVLVSSFNAGDADVKLQLDGIIESSQGIFQILLDGGGYDGGITLTDSGDLIG